MRHALFLSALAFGIVLAPAAGKTASPSSADHTPPIDHAKVKPHVLARHKPHEATKPRHVPVLSPRHAGPPRHPTAKAAAGRHAAIVRETPAPVLAVPAVPKKPPPLPADVGSNTKMHLPRYASLKSDDVNMRVGPAERYPVIWTYKRRELPVKIEREFDIWRLVEDMDGIKGWVHQATLTGRRTFVITGSETRTLRSEASETADAVAVLKPGVVGRVKSCEAGKAWCQVQVQDYRGWLQRGDFWGVESDEPVAP